MYEQYLLQNKDCFALDVQNVQSNELVQIRTELLSSLLLFTQIFFKIRTGRNFIISEPIGRESHLKTISRELTLTFNNQTKRLWINIPPRFGKTELAIHFVAWTLAQYPDSNFLYVSSSKELATRATSLMRDLMQLSAYRKIFGVWLSEDSAAKDHFKTNYGGEVEAIGQSGSITGKGAGIKGISDRFGGAAIIDDILQANDAFSDTVREGANEWYHGAFLSRLNSPHHTPIVTIGQRLHEHDLFGYLDEKEGEKWKKLIIKNLDDAGNALDPNMLTKEDLLEMAEKQPYVFSSQHQQSPTPVGGGVFKKDWFLCLDQQPDILTTFITVDTAETKETHNDATVFSLWGLYQIEQMGKKTNMYGLHWLNCWQIWVEPKDLQKELMNFYGASMIYGSAPFCAAIEKKSTGSTLASSLASIQGLKIIDIPRGPSMRGTKSNTKASRYISIQAYLSQKLVTFTLGAKHYKMCVDECEKITINDTHRRDDIADTLYDAVKIALIDKVIPGIAVNSKDQVKTANHMIQQQNRIEQLRRARRW